MTAHDGSAGGRPLDAALVAGASPTASGAQAADEALPSGGEPRGSVSQDTGRPDSARWLGAASRWRAFRAWRHPSFRVFWIGLFVSLVGSTMHNTALGWLVWRLTGSGQALGLIGFAGHAPIIPLGLLAGAIVDRLDRRRLVFWSQVVSMMLAFVTAELAWSGQARIWQLVLLAFLFGLINVIEVPARQTFLMDMVGPDDLVSAVALNSSAFNAARVVGPGLAGVLIASISEAGCFLINGLSFLALIVAMLVMAPPEHTVRKPPQPGPLAPLDGLRHILRSPEMRGLLLLIGTANLFALPYHQMMPVYVTEVLGGDSRWLGALTGCFALGALVGLFGTARREISALKPTRAAQAFVAHAVGLLLLALLPGRAAAIGILPVMGYCLGTQLSITNGFLQSHAPEGLRGRVIATYTTTLLGCFPIGCLLMGWTADRLGVRWAMGAGALACLAIWLAWRLAGTRSAHEPAAVPASRERLTAAPAPD